MSTVIFSERNKVCFTKKRINQVKNVSTLSLHLSDIYHSASPNFICAFDFAFPLSNANCLIHLIEVQSERTYLVIPFILFLYLLNDRSPSCLWAAPSNWTRDSLRYMTHNAVFKERLHAQKLLLL